MSSHAANLGRRRLLQALGLGAGSLFLPSLAPRGRAGADGAPCRVLFVMTYHGTVYESWNMRPVEAPLDAPWAAPLGPLAPEQFSEILAPLHPYRDRMMVLDGVDLVTAKAMGGGAGHFVGPIVAMTGAAATAHDSTARSTARSLDQILADHLARPGQFRSLEVGRFDQPISYDTPGQALPREFRPNSLWTRLFPAGAQPEDGPPTIASRVSAAQSSVLDRVADAYDRLQPRLGAEDRAKLDLHRDMVRDLELRLANYADLECTVPAEPELPGASAPDYYNLQYSAFAQLLTVAFACDLTRVATVALTEMPNSAFGAPPGSVHQDFAHLCDPPDPDPVAVTQMTHYNRHHAGHVLELLDLLAAVPEGNGTMLDNTLVVWLNEMANGTHRQDPYPMVLLGGGNLPLAWGQYLYWPRTGPIVAGSNPFNQSRHSGLPHNRVLVAIARAFGVDIDAIGDTSIAAVNGSTIDCTGAADRVLA